MKTNTSLRVSALALVLCTGGCAIEQSEDAPSAGAPASGAAKDDPASLPVARAAAEHLRATTAIEGLELLATRVTRDDRGYTHVRFRQKHAGLPVHAAEAIVHYGPDGRVFAVTDDLLRNVAVDTKKTTIARADAHALALAAYAKTPTRAPESERFVYRDAAGKDHVAYKVDLLRMDGATAPEEPTIVVDAHDGAVLARWNNVSETYTTAPSQYRKYVTVTTAYNTTTKKYYLEDLGRSYATFDNQGHGTGDGYIDASDLDRVRISDTDNTFDAARNAASVDVHWGAMKTLDYLARTHQWIGVDGKNGPQTSIANDGSRHVLALTTHYGAGWQNAAWVNALGTAVFGDGNGTDSTPWVSLDVVAHELMHGVTATVAGLPTSGEGGALNESMSDILAAMVSRSVDGEDARAWRMADEVNRHGAIRDLAETHDAARAVQDFDGTADHWSELYPTNATWDGGAVHFNSTIASKAFYLVAKGGRHHLGGQMSGVGVLAAEAIWWKAVNDYMTSATTFASARTATLNAASQLYGSGSDEWKAVATAWHLVGIGASGTERVVNGDFEAAAGWTVSGAAGIIDGGTRHAGTASLLMGLTDDASGSATTSVTIPAGSLATNLTFFVSTKTSETGLPANVDNVAIEILDATGKVVKTLGGILPIYQSTWVQLGYDLSAFRGQSFKLRFRVANNASGPSIFWIDDVSIQ